MIEIIIAFLMGFGISGLIVYLLARKVIAELKERITELKERIRRYQLNERLWRIK